MECFVGSICEVRFIGECCDDEDPPVPQNAVTHLGVTVTHMGEVVTHEGV